VLIRLSQRPSLLLPKIFGEFAQRYADRPGGYTRVLRVEPKKEDQAASAILEMVDSPRDMRFMLTARTLAYRRKQNLPMNEPTATNVKKVTAYRKDGVAELRELVARFENMEPFAGEVTKLPVYPDPMQLTPKQRNARTLEKKKRDDPFPWRS
jgi:large subunit ribosomal protein L17